MLTERPKSIYEDKNGIIILDGKVKTEYQEVIDWDKQYAKECDDLSEKEVPYLYRKWGRWFIDGKYLSTWIVIPKIRNEPSYKCETYDFKISRCNEDWISQLSTHRWIGIKGLDDLRKALDYVRKNENEVNG